MTAILSQIAHLDVPPSVLAHRFVREAWTVTGVVAKRDNDDRVVGTTNRKGEPRCELYGWGPCIAPHMDNTGWVYFVPLRGRPSLIMANPGYSQPGCSLIANVGDVIRLDDHAIHSTYDDSRVVCLFMGPYHWPDDDAAVAALTTGLAQLATGEYIAPRVAKGFRHPADDECYVLNSAADGAELMPLAEAKAHGRIIANCGLCDKRAWHLDRHFPWMWDMNRCEKHFKARSAPTDHCTSRVELPTEAFSFNR